MTEPWAALLKEALPYGYQRSARRHGGTEIAERSRWLNLGVKQPNAKNVWNLAKRARGNGASFSWCAGPLFLWAAGHYFDFARVMICSSVDARRKFELVSYVDAACSPTEQAASPGERRLALLEAGYKELEIRAALKEPTTSTRRDRVVWELRDPEPAAFERSFIHGVEVPSGPLGVAAFTCEAIVRHEKRGVNLQKAAVLATLLHAFD
jgi:hypothetical protein